MSKNIRKWNKNVSTIKKVYQILHLDGTSTIKLYGCVNTNQENFLKLWFDEVKIKQYGDRKICPEITFPKPDENGFYGYNEDLFLDDLRNKGYELWVVNFNGRKFKRW